MASNVDLNVAILQAELARIDARIQREVARWAQAGQDPHDAFRGLKISDDEAQALAARPLGANWARALPPLLRPRAGRRWKPAPPNRPPSSRPRPKRPGSRCGCIT